MDFPVLLNSEIPRIYAYSIYTAIAEKFEAFVSLGMANSRYKDFYDIYTLAKTYDLDGNILKNAIVETFSHRKTAIDNIVAFDEVFVNDPINIQRWNTFNKKKKVLNIISFKETIDLVKIIFIPIVESITNDINFDKKWSKDRNIWE